MFNSLFRKNKELSTCYKMLENEDYESIPYLFQSPLQIDTRQQDQAAELYIEALKRLDRIDSPITGLFGGPTYSKVEKEIVAMIPVRLLNGGLNPNTTFEGRPLIHAVIENVHSSKSMELGVGALARAGANVNAESDTGKTVLGTLLCKGMLSADYEASALVEAGAILNESDLSDFGLYRTIFESGLYEVAKLIPSSFLNRFANMQDENSLTLLHYAAGGLALRVRGDSDQFNALYEKKGCYPMLVEMLLEAGADVSAKTNMGHDALSIALRFGHMSTYDVLEKWSSASGNLDGKEAVNRAVGSKATELFLAALENNLDRVRYLLEHGADPNIPSFINYDFMSEGKMLPQGVPSIVASLMFEQNMMKTMKPSTFLDMSLGLSNLHYPCLNGYSEVVHMLLEAGENPNARSFTGIFPLYTAAEMGHLEIVKDLVSHGADIDQQTPLGCTALLNAAEEGQVDTVRFLLSAGANPTIANNAGITPREAALRYGQLDVAQLLEKF